MYADACIGAAIQGFGYGIILGLMIAIFIASIARVRKG